MNAWNLEDDISRIDSRAEDCLSGIWNADSSVLKKKSGWKARSEQDSSNPFCRFQTSPSGRKSPTPLADLYYQSINQAELDSDSWQSPESCNHEEELTDDEEIGLPGMKDVECMPQDLFSFSQQDAAYTGESSFGTLNRSLTNCDGSIIDETVSSSEENKYAPRLLADIARDNSERPARSPLLSLSVGMSICGVGLVFGAQIMHNAAVINPGKSLIIAGLIGLFVSFLFQGVKLFGKRKAA